MSHHAKKILILKLIWSVINKLLDFYITIFFLQVSPDNLYKLIAYNVCRLTVLAALFVLLGKYGKSRHRLTIIRLSLIPGTLYFLSLVCLRERSCDYWYIIAFLHGLMTGMYHSCYNSFEVDNLRGEKLGRFVGIYECICMLSKIVIMGASGFLINKFGHVANFIALTIMTVLQLILFMLTKDKAVYNSGQEYSLHKAYRFLKKKSYFGKLANMQILQGITTSCAALETIVTIVIMRVVYNTATLGIVNAVGYIVAAISGLVFARVYKHGRLVGGYLYLIGTIYILALAIMHISPSPVMVFIFYFCNQIWKRTNNMMSETASNNIALMSGDQTQEYMVIYDLWLWIGRILGFLLLILWSLNERFIAVFIIALIADAAYLNKLSEHLKDADLAKLH